MMFIQEVHFVSWREVSSDITTFFHGVKYFHSGHDFFHGVKGKFCSHSNNV